MILDEHVKHRLIGLAVILSIAAIFTPALIKKSNQRMEERISVSVKLPPRPLLPKVAIPSEKTLLKTLHTAQVDFPKTTKAPKSNLKATSLSQLNELREALASVAEHAKTKPIQIIHKKPVLATSATKTLKKLTQSPKIKEYYTVQLATFSKQENAESLLKKLRAKGYTANYHKMTSAKGSLYKVVVGKVRQKEQAQVLQQQLASTMQINGLVIMTGVS